MNKLKKIFICTLSVLLLNTGIIAHAAENIEEREYTQNDIPPSTSSHVDKYIYFDQASKSFKIDEIGIKRDVSENELSQIVQQVEDTNQRIHDALKSDIGETNIYAVDAHNRKLILKESLARGRGKNAVEFHWNYARIFIDAGNVSLALQLGFVISTIHVPAKAVQAVCAVLGIASGNVNHGIWFDYNYLMGILCGNYGFL